MAIPYELTVRIADMDEVREAMESARAEIESLREALREHVEHEDGPCRLDHHGDCQDHCSFGDGECHVRRHRRMLGLPLNDG